MEYLKFIDQHQIPIQAHIWGLVTRLPDGSGVDNCGMRYHAVGNSDDMFVGNGMVSPVRYYSILNGEIEKDVLCMYYAAAYDRKFSGRLAAFIRYNEDGIFEWCTADTICPIPESDAILKQMYSAYAGNTGKPGHGAESLYASAVAFMRRVVSCQEWYGRYFRESNPTVHAGNVEAFIYMFGSGAHVSIMPVLFSDERVSQDKRIAFIKEMLAGNVNYEGITEDIFGEIIGLSERFGISIAEAVALWQRHREHMDKVCTFMNLMVYFGHDTKNIMEAVMKYRGDNIDGLCEWIVRTGFNGKEFCLEQSDNHSLGIVNGIGRFLKYDILRKGDRSFHGEYVKLPEFPDDLSAEYAVSVEMLEFLRMGNDAAEPVYIALNFTENVARYDSLEMDLFFKVRIPETAGELVRTYNKCLISAEEAFCDVKDAARGDCCPCIFYDDGKPLFAVSVSTRGSGVIKTARIRMHDFTLDDIRRKYVHMAHEWAIMKGIRIVGITKDGLN